MRRTPQKGLRQGGKVSVVPTGNHDYAVAPDKTPTTWLNKTKMTTKRMSQAGGVGRGRGRGGRGGRGRGGRGASAAQAREPFDPSNGDPTNLSCWSLTIGASGCDVPSWWLNRTRDYLVAHDLRGAATLEKGGKHEVLHIQAIVEITSNRDAVATAAFRQHYRDFVPLTSSDSAKLTFKPLAAGQTFPHMLGYVQKDLGKPHYALVKHNVSDAELEEARKVYSDVSADYKKGKILISKTALGERYFSFWFSNYRPFWVPVDVGLWHMIRSGKYAPGATWAVCQFGKAMGPEVINAFLHMIIRPTACTLDHVRILFFNAHLARPTQMVRYFLPGGMPDFGRGCTELQKKCAEIWYTHHEDVDTMVRVVFELRSSLAVNNIGFDDHNMVDTVFAYCFEDALDKVRSTVDGLRIRHDAQPGLGIGGVSEPGGAATRTSSEMFYSTGEGGEDIGGSLLFGDGEEEEEEGYVEGMEIVECSAKGG